MFGALTLWARTSDWFDHAIANIITLVSAGITVIATTTWFAFVSEYPQRLRYGVLAVMLASIALAAAIFRIEDVNGELVPRFVLRWSPSRDQLLEKLRAEVAEPRQDLLAPGEHDFPQFLGPTRSAKIDGPALETDWHKSPPELVWRRPIGAGWSAFAVVGRAAVTMEQRDTDELVTCYDLPTGKLLWSHGIQARHDEKLGGPGPRATPTIDEGRVYALGATGVLRCLNGNDGGELWVHNVTEEFGLTHEEDMALVAWGRSASPLVVDSLVIVPAGGKLDRPPVSLVAYDKVSGKKVWEGGDQQIGFASPSLAEIVGVRQVLITNEASISSHDPATGRVLWRVDWPGSSTTSANTSQAVLVNGDRVFASKGYGAGAALFQVTRDEKPGWKVDNLWQASGVMKTKFTNVAIHDGYIYGLSDGILECVALDSGKRQWKQGRYLHGQVLLVNDVLVVQAESGEVALVAANPKRFTELARFQAIEGKTWNNPVIVQPYLLVRNSEEAACYKIPLKE